MKLFDLINPLKLVQFFTLSFGGGGSSSGTPYYANQDKLFGAQADIATNLYNQYAGLAPGYLQNSLDMTNEAMDGTLGTRARNTAGADASQAFGQNMQAVNRNTARFGADFNANRMGSMQNDAAVSGALGKANAMNSASQWAEDQKWNRNANAYGQIAGMGSGAMQGMGQAASGYGQMANGIQSNNAANAAGMGKFGASIGSSMFKADGGYINHLADGGMPQRVTKPLGYVQHVSAMNPIDWRSYATSGNPGSGGVNPLAAIAGGVAARAGMEGLGAGMKTAGNAAWDYGKNAIADMRGPSDASINTANLGEAAQKSALGVQQDAMPGVVDAYRNSPQGIADTGEEAQNSALEAQKAWLEEYLKQQASQQASDSAASVVMAKGGMVHKRGLHLAGGAYVTPSYGLADPYTNRSEGPDAFDQMGNMAANKMATEGVKAAGNAAYDYATNAAMSSGNPGYSGAEAFGQQQGATYGDSAQAAADQAEFNSPEFDYTGGESGESISSGTDMSGSVANAPVEAGAETTASAAGDAGASAAADASASAAAESATGAAATTAAETAAAEAAAAAAAEAAGSAAAVEGAEALALLLLKDGGKVGGLPKRKNLKPGGKVAGPGTETSDSIPAWLSDGEFVLNAEAVKLIGKDKLEALNNQGLKRRGQAPQAPTPAAGEHVPPRGLQKADGSFIKAVFAANRGVSAAKGLPDTILDGLKTAGNYVSDKIDEGKEAIRGVRKDNADFKAKQVARATGEDESEYKAKGGLVTKRKGRASKKA